MDRCTATAFHIFQSKTQILSFFEPLLHRKLWKSCFYLLRTALKENQNKTSFVKECNWNAPKNFKIMLVPLSNCFGTSTEHDFWKLFDQVLDVSSFETVLGWAANCVFDGNCCFGIRQCFYMKYSCIAQSMVVYFRWRFAKRHFQNKNYYSN